MSVGSSKKEKKAEDSFVTVSLYSYMYTQVKFKKKIINIGAISFLFGGIRNSSEGRGLTVCCCMESQRTAIPSPSIRRHGRRIPRDIPSVESRCGSSFRHNKPCFRQQDTRSDIYLIRLQATRRLPRTRIRSHWGPCGRVPPGSFTCCVDQSLNSTVYDTYFRKYSTWCRY